MVPAYDSEQYPTLGPFVVAFIEEHLCHGPGDMLGKPVVLNTEQRGWIWRLYEVEPMRLTRRRKGIISHSANPRAGHRRFQRCALSLRKGSAKTEFAAWIAAVELHADGPVRCVGFHKDGHPIPGPVMDPYIPMISYSEEQTEELAYGALRRILQEMPIGNDFDIGLERILRLDGKGKAEAVSTSPNARDGARTTFQHADEALALDTPLPTPTGWTTMGEVQPGDYLIARDGYPARVLGKSPIHESRNCYRVTFEDGSSVVTDGGHLWFARRRGGCGHGQGCRCGVRQGWAVRTTESMKDVLFAAGKRPAYTYHIPVGAPIQRPDVSLPVDPYVLGLWLGDGDARNAMIHAGFVDSAEIAGLVRSCGYRVTEGALHSAARMYVTTLDSGPRSGSLVGRLRALGLLQDKHIPELYLRAGTSQRLALMQGLMDSDGSVSPRGDCVFVNTSSALIEGFEELSRSLGFVPSTRWREDDRKGSYRRVAKVAFQADRAMPVFRLERKMNRLKPVRLSRHNALAVVSVEPVESVPVQCVAVDAPDSLFRAGVGMLVTHNTHRLILDGQKRAWTVMLANLAKRPMADPWALETTTAPEPGGGSVAEGTMEYARQVATGRAQNARLFFYHREASPDHDISTRKGLKAAIVEASGPYIAQWSDINRIANSFEEPGADRPYLERVWLNRLVQSSGVAFDIKKWRARARILKIEDGSAIALGFDGGRFDDATALSACHLASGHIWLPGLWEKPDSPEVAANWEVPTDEVDGLVHDMFERFNVTRFYCDPPKWESWVSAWAGEFGDKRVLEWWTNRRKPMAYALRSFISAIDSAELSHDGDKRLDEHIGNSRQQFTNLVDEKEQRLWILRKERPDSPKKIDAAMSSVLAWEARNDSIAAGEGDTPEPSIHFLAFR